MLDLTSTVGDSIRIATGVISTLTPQHKMMYAALTPEMLATEIADYLVRRGVPFREGHHISGQVVVLAEKEGVPMVSRGVVASRTTNLQCVTGPSLL